MDGAMGKEEEVVEAVLTCEGDFHDPELLNHLEKFRLKLTDLLLADEGELNLTKVEPWNSVKVTFTIPREAALRLRQLAQAGNEVLRQMGVLSVQIQGDSSISLKIVGRNNETTELMLHTSRNPSSSTEQGVNVSTANDLSSPGPSNEEVTRRNIVDYLIQGPPNLRPNAVFNSILGANTASASFPTAHRGIPAVPDSFPRSSRPILRPNSMTSMVAQSSPAQRGSQPNNFPFAKTSGAFHVPIPQHSSAGQSSSDFPHSSPMNNSAHGRIVNSSGFQSSGSQQKTTLGTTNVFGPIGTKLPGSSTISETLPPSSSPGFLIDLPPPPPYPHSSSNNSTKMGKQVSATSPLLVNLLQTDPLAVNAGMAGGTGSKTVSAGTLNSGNTSPAPSVKKKKRPKKPKEMVHNSFSNIDDMSHMDPLSANTMLNPSFSTDTARIPDPSASFSTKLQKEFIPGLVPSAQSFSTIHRPEVESKTDKLLKPLVSSGRPFSENSMNSSALTLSKFNANVDSAIGSDRLRSGEINGPRALSQEVMDSFSKEIASGKIINPYTGQLEPRDKSADGKGGKCKDDMFGVFPHSREIGNANSSDMPVSQRMDINVLRHLTSVSSSTAALFHSGSTVHLNNEKPPSQFLPHRRNFSDSSVGTNKKVYAAKLTSKSDTDNFLSSISPSLPQPNFNSHQVSANSPQSQVKSSNPSPVPSPSSSFTNVQGRPISSQHVLSSHTVPSSLLSSGVSESVINSKPGSLCSTTALPVTHKDSFVKHLEHNPSLFQLTSCANSNSQNSVPHHPHSSQMFSSSSSQSVVQTRPVLSSQAQSSLQASGRLVLSDASKSIPSQHVQAASSDPISRCSKTNFPHLLNSLPDKSLDQHSMIQSPLEKVSPEGDDNSNHSGLVSENLPENSGTSVLLEHTGVKVENHDSGVGSSSERSDDTPSEPGDGEFRANNSCSEPEEGNKTMKKLVNYKSDVGNDSSCANTITVGYMMSSVDNASHLKSSQTKDKQEENKAPTGSSNMKYDNSLDTQVNSHHKTSELPSGRPLSSADWMLRNTQMQSSTYSGKGKLNGPLSMEKEDGFKSTKKEFPNDSKLNGPSSKEVDEMLLTIQGLEEKVEQVPSSNSPAFKRHSLHGQSEVLEEMARLQQLAASKELSNAQGKLDKEDSPDSLLQNVGSNEDRHEQLPFFDMDDLVNGKLFGNGTPNVDNKTGSNITSIYSKRSSPVNVNMLNHIYAPGLPLPRRLTESVQRLVKPLPTSESSMPQMRPCKSPGAGSPRAGTTPNGPSPSRMAFHSGTRSPGSSVPKLMPYDKHSLLSGGLDLAGLSSKVSPNSLPLSELGSDNVPGDSSSRMLGLATDFLSRDGHGQAFSSCHISPPLLTDSLAHTQKMLSQSYPPHKSRDLSNSVSIHDLFSRIQHPVQSSAESSWQDSSSHLLKSSSEPTISPQQSQVPVQRHQHNILNSMSKADTFTTNIEPSPLNSSKTTTYSGSSLSSSSPNHSRSTSPTTLVNSNRSESSVVSRANSVVFKTAADTGGLLPHWANKISLNNGSKNSSNQKSAVSSQKNVPYVTLSSSSVAGSAVHSSQSISSRITPAVCSALLSASVGNPLNSTIDNRAVLKSSKPDLCSPPRTVNKSEFSLSRSSPISSTLGRNLFESVSCDLPTVPYSVQTSRNKALDTLISHSSSKSVLDLNHTPDLNIQNSKGQRRKSDSSQGRLSPSLNFHSDINSLQSIRTNETPSTSLPAQVVHLDFPHLPPTVSETAISNPVVDHALSVSQKLVKSPVPSPSKSNSSSNNWNSTLASSVTTSAPFPVKTNPVSKTNLPPTTVKLDKKDLPNKNEPGAPPSLVKEPILETLASALNKMNEQHNQNAQSSNLNLLPVPVTTVPTDDNDIGESILPDISNKVKSDNETPSSSEQIASPKRISKKRGSHMMEGEQGETEGDSCSAAKLIALEGKSDSLRPFSSDKLADTDVIDQSESEKPEVSSKPDPIEIIDQNKDDELSLPSLTKSNEECEGNIKEHKKSPVHASEVKVRPDTPLCNITTPQSPAEDDKSIPILSKANVSECVDNSETISEEAGERPPEDVSESQELENSHSNMIFDITTQNKMVSFQNKDNAPQDKQDVNLDNIKTVTENKGNQQYEDLLEQNKEKKDLENSHDPDSMVSTLNVETKGDDGSKKGHRVKRQFYAYVPEKSIDQTYFDTPILSGRTRSRNKPSEPAGNSENTGVNQEGHNATTSSSDSQLSTGNSGVKTEATDAGNKRSTRSLRTKDNSQDLTAMKRRRLQTRDHR